jgi:hypothetical protein
MDASPAKKRSAPKPGLRALEACGDGFWELDLNSGSAWYSSWFYQRLGWSSETRRTTLGELQPVFTEGSWTRFLARMRTHLEQGQPLEIDVEVNLPPATASTWWRIRGSAVRNAAGQPVFLAGSMREVGGDPAGAGGDRVGGSADRAGAGAPSDLLGVRGAFDALPVAAALLDARAALIEANREWRAFPAATTRQAIARLKAANSQTGIEFWLEQGEEFDAGPRRLRVRAIAFQHEGARHLAVTLEDRRSD